MKSRWCICLIILGLFGLIWTRAGKTAPRPDLDPLACLQLGPVMLDFKSRGDRIRHDGPMHRQPICQFSDVASDEEQPFLSAVTSDGQRGVRGIKEDGSPEAALARTMQRWRDRGWQVVSESIRERWCVLKNNRNTVFLVAVPLSENATSVFQIIEVKHGS